MSDNELVFQRIHPARQPVLTIAADTLAVRTAALSQGQILPLAVDAAMLAIVSATVAGVNFKPATVNGGLDKKTIAKVYITSNANITAVAADTGGGTVLHKVGLGGLNVCVVVRPDSTTGYVKILATTTSGSVVSATVEHRGYSTTTASVTLA